MMLTDSNAPLVAIVTPVYNGARYLAEALESVQTQDYPNLVHVVIDNASTDATPEILSSFAGRRVPLIVHRNADLVPMADNWNRAVCARPPEAKYFHLLCADDTLHPYSIRKRVEVAERDPDIGVVACQWRAAGLCGEELPRDRDVFDGREIMRSYFRREHMGLSGMFVLVRAAKVDPSRPFYDPGLIAAIDTDATLRVALHSKVGFVHEELAYWRIHEEQATSTFVQRGRHILSDWFVMLDRYGPYVMGHKEYLACRQAYRRYYLRRLLLIRYKDKDEAVFRWHMNAMKARDDAAGLLDFADALFDWATLAVAGARDKVGAPRRRSFGQPVLLPKFSA